MCNVTPLMCTRCSLIPPTVSAIGPVAFIDRPYVRTRSVMNDREDKVLRSLV